MHLGTRRCVVAPEPVSPAAGSKNPYVAGSPIGIRASAAGGDGNGLAPHGVLTTEKIGDALKQNKELNELLASIERERAHLSRGGGSISGAQGELVPNRWAAVRRDPSFKPLTDPHSSQGSLGSMCASRFMLHPDSKTSMWWDCLLVVFVLISCVTTPLRLAFESEYSGVLAGVIRTDMAADVWFALDIVFNFLLGYRQLDAAGTTIEVVMSPARIAKRYVRTWLSLDVLSTFPFELVLEDAGGSGGGVRLNRVLRAARLVKLIKIVRASRAMRLLEARTTGANPAIIRLAQLSLALLLLWHWLACSWYAVHWFASADGTTQLVPLIMDTDPLGRPRDDGSLSPGHRFMLQYSFAYYWAITSICASSSLTDPQGWPDALFNSCATVIGMFTTAAVIGSASSAIVNMDATSAQIRERLDRLKVFLRQKRTPPSVARQVLAYAEYAWKHSRSTDEAWLMQELPSGLRLQVIVSLQRRLYTSIELFRLLDTATVTQIICHMRPLIVLPGERVIEQGHDGGHGLFFITEGSVAVLVDEQPVALLTQGHFFGEQSLLDGKPTNATVEAAEYVRLMVLYRTEFLQLLRAHPQIGETIRALKERKAAEAEQREAAERSRKRQMSGLMLQRTERLRSMLRMNSGDLPSRAQRGGSSGPLQAAAAAKAQTAPPGPAAGEANKARPQCAPASEAHGGTIIGAAGGDIRPGIQLDERGSKDSHEVVSSSRTLRGKDATRTDGSTGAPSTAATTTAAAYKDMTAAGSRSDGSTPSAQPVAPNASSAVSDALVASHLQVMEHGEGHNGTRSSRTWEMGAGAGNDKLATSSFEADGALWAIQRVPYCSGSASPHPSLPSASSSIMSLSDADLVNAPSVGG